MLRIYGTLRCPDCVECLADLDKAKVEYEFLDFDKDLKLLKELLKLRDQCAEFAEVREAGNIGIPCIVRPDGSVSLSWEEFL